ncbi:MAG TPA: PQQ-binding-like beta-propeller repeat protein [Ktedonobacteraceae bacterium]|nr:PQQ-binding-like beta-propeller repeat protein [Ktedonobacteraceae bacterium]
MNIGLTLVVISALLSIPLTYVLSPLFRKENNKFSTKLTCKNVTWVGMSLLLVFLSACSGLTSSNGDTSPSITPLALTATPQSKAISITPNPGSTDWTTYHANNLRTGYIPNTPDPHSLSKIWSTQLDGSVYAEPLVVGNRIIVATEGDSLYALDPNTGSIQWHTNVGTPVPLSSLPCGNIDPLGITGTPVYDPATGLVFAVAEISGPAHILIGLDVNTGQVKVRRSVDTDGMDPRAHQQRPALALANGMVYFTYGGLDGDCSDYIGRVVASRTNGQGPLLVFTVPTPREGGIWATPGPSIDALGNLYVSVGNGAITSGQWDHSDSVLKLSPTLQLLDAFAPSNWGQENANDEDLGSQGPALLPGNFIFSAGKSGNGYILNANNLGGVGGSIDEQSVCRSFGGTATVGSTIFVPCTNGLLQISVDTSGHMHQGWQASSDIVGSPVVGGHTVYSFSNGVMHALSMNSGQLVASLNVGPANRFVSPTIYGTSIFIGTDTGISAIKIS